MEKLDVTPFVDKEDKIPDTKFCSGIYFHGKLEEDLGYDLVSEPKEEILSYFLENMKEKETKTLLIKVKVKEEIVTACAYLWKVNNINRGLICYTEDFKSKEDAKKKQLELRNFI